MSLLSIESAGMVTFWYCEKASCKTNRNARTKTIFFMAGWGKRV
jgi:hypothetical protein